MHDTMWDWIMQDVTGTDAV